MSYMNDDCDPFGVPYTSSSNYTEIDKEYSFKDLENIRVKELKLAEVKNEKEKAIEQLKKKISRYVEPYAKIKCDEHTNWEIIVDEFKLSQLEKLKEDFNLKDIKVGFCKLKRIGDKYENRILIKLFVG